MKGVTTEETEEEAATTGLGERAVARDCSAMTHWAWPDRQTWRGFLQDGRSTLEEFWGNALSFPMSCQRPHLQHEEFLWTASNTEASVLIRETPPSYLHVRPRSWGQESKLETNGPSRAGLFSHLFRLLFPEADLVVRLVMPALPERLGSGVLQLWTLGWRITLKTVGKR